MNDATDSRLQGTWVTDSADPATLKRFGHSREIFRPDGTLTVMLEAQGQESVILLEYRTEGDLLITNQPSAPREEKTKFVMSGDGRLILGEGSDSSRWVRISTGSPMTPGEAAARARIARPSPADHGASVWGGMKLKEFRLPGLRVWYPESWTQRYHEDGAPYFIGPREDSGLIRLGVVHHQPKQARRLFTKKPPSPDEMIQGLIRNDPGSTIVELGQNKAVYKRMEDADCVHHEWILPEKSLLVVGTYTEQRDVSQTPQGREELEIARRILISLLFEGRLER